MTYQWPAEQLHAQSDRGRWSTRNVLLVGAAGLGGLFALAAMSGGGAAAGAEPWTASSLADSLDAGAERGGEPVELEDVVCRSTSRVEPSGDGMWVCSWRVLGSAEQWVSTVETIGDEWSSSQTAVPGSAAELTPDQVERVLVEPLAVSGERWAVLSG